ncbi:MAG: photosynthetic reaction center subunit H [Hyphomicrobiales bacterium]|nr:photosynthetic reaction center subunit H [Hyphomicrobiales bacterium]
MGKGEITGYIDVAQVALYVFFAFFFALVFWLRKEDRREGYPLESDPTGKVKDIGAGILFAKPKTFHVRSGETFTAPNFKRDERPVAARRVGSWPGAPMVPTGNPMIDGVGPAAWAERADRPDTTWDNKVKIVPTRADSHYTVANGDPDPRGMSVKGADGKVAGTVTDLWVDRAEHVVRYLEIDAGPGAGPLLVPMNVAKIVGNRTKGRSVRVRSILAAQFQDAPRIKSPDSVTFLEEDRICAYFAGGNLYATPKRTEPLL